MLDGACKEPRLAGQGMEMSEVVSVYLRLPSQLDTTLHCLTRASSTNFISNVPVIELFTFLSLFLALSASSASLLHLILLDNTRFCLCGIVLRKVLRYRKRD